MSGIVGKVYRDRTRPVDPTQIARMKEAIRHRGPDGDGSWFFPSVGLGCRRLAIIDSATGSQPMFNEDRTVVIVFDGEIYNFLDLRLRLTALGHIFTTRTDTEVIVHGYEQWGDSVIEKLRGMFAFAVFDTRLHHLLLARDRFGKKPLYYTHVSKGSPDEALIFGSELKALLAVSEVSRRLDYTALDHYLTYGYVPEPLCMIDGIKKLPPAHRLCYRKGELSIQPYWKLDYEPKTIINEEEAVNAVQEKMEEAVRLRLTADVPLGFFLSSGLDSASIVALAGRHLPGKLQTFSAAVAGAKKNELENARAVARHFHTDHHELLIHPDAAEALSGIVWMLGEPNMFDSCISFFYLHRWVAGHFKVMLSGDGGDESFAGYRVYQPREQRRWWDSLPRVIRRKLLGPMESAAVSRMSNTRLLKAVDRCRRSLMEDDERYVQKWMLFPDYLRRGLLAPDLGGRLLAPQNRAEMMMEEIMLAPSPSALLDRMTYSDWRMHMPGLTFPKADRLSMAHGMEIRSPFCDHELVELISRFPAGIKLKGGEPKFLLKSAMRPHLPPFLFGLKKIGFGELGEDFYGNSLRGLAEELLLDATARSRGHFDLRYVRILVGQHFSGHYDYYKRFWALLVLEAWLRTFIDRPDPLAGPLDFSP